MLLRHVYNETFEPLFTLFFSINQGGRINFWGFLREHRYFDLVAEVEKLKIQSGYQNGPVKANIL